MVFATVVATHGASVLSTLFLALVVGVALDLVSGFVTAPGATLTGLTMAAGDSLTVRQAQNAKNIRLLNFWGTNKVAGAVRVRSPRMHDNIQGIRALTLVGNGMPLMPWAWTQPLYSQDNLIVEQSGSAVGGAIEQTSMLVYYDAIDGSSGAFISPDEVRKRGVNMMTVRTTHAFGAGGGYTGQVALNSTDDNGKMGKSYAILGYKVSAQCGAIAYRGVDTGNLRAGGPGIITNQDITESWFMKLSNMYQLPLVPVINWANKAGIFVDGTQDDGAAAVTLQTYLVELS